MSLRDAHGNAVSTSSAAALAASDSALWRMMSFYGVPGDDLDAAARHDPAWLLPPVMKAGFLLSLTEPSLHAEARAALGAADRLGPGGNDRERAHLAAVHRLAAGDWSGAAAAWDALLAGHPRDALALQWGHLLDFYRGDAESLRERIARAVPAWRADDPLQPYVLGLHAFGLEEAGRHAEAEAVGRQALAGPARVPWAIHAVAHVMEMQGRHEEGRRWMGEWRAHWGEGNGFAGHLGWHEALFALESLDHAGALAAFDAYLRAEANEITLQRVDAASMLWRLMLHGADVGERWQALLARWPLDDPDSAGHSVFNDLHVLLAMLGSGDLRRAEAWVERSIADASLRDGWNREVMAELGAPLLHGLLAFGSGRFDAATRALRPLRGRLARIGGSHGQRDLVEQTLLAAAVRGGDSELGRQLLAQRLAARRATPLSEWWASRLADH
ncbi:MAG TPA: tetratricopeptide repeat protein [Caldimonas sp.]|jgi:hypothetical protein|nr:tetratricopeptide repeat protein [Caldimonas sp.]HEX2542128.1 tetratricopeptide repeat protein [Caldimonas sp.]